MQRQRHVLAIDLGTSGPKAAVVDVTGRTPGTARASVDTLTQPGGIAEQDARQVWDAVKSAAVRALAASGVGSEDIVAVICTSQYSSIVPVDRDGEPTSNMVLWQDHRGTEEGPAGRGWVPEARRQPRGPAALAAGARHCRRSSTSLSLAAHAAPEVLAPGRVRAHGMAPRADGLRDDAPDRPGDREPGVGVHVPDDRQPAPGHHRLRAAPGGRLAHRPGEAARAGPDGRHRRDPPARRRRRARALCRAPRSSPGSTTPRPAAWARAPSPARTPRCPWGRPA